jgi:four helix bundle protein
VNAEGGSRNAEHQARRTPPHDLKLRTKAFAVEIVRLVQELPGGRIADVVGRQLLKAGTSVAANYRSARRARSRREFLAKMGIVEEESDESLFWLDLLVETRLVTSARVYALRQEAGELLAITVTSIHTARRGRTAVPRSAFRVPRSAQCS